MFSGCTSQRVNWTRPGWRFWSSPSCKDQQQNLHIHTRACTHAHTHARTNAHTHTMAAHQETRKQAKAHLHMSVTLPWTTKLTACLSACMRTLQSGEEMYGRVRLRPIMESTYPNKSKIYWIYPSICIILTTWHLCIHYEGGFWGTEFNICPWVPVLSPHCEQISIHVILIYSMQRLQLSFKTQKNSEIYFKVVGT